MKTARKVLSGIVAVIMAAAFAGCPNEPSADVVWTATARGAPQTTTAIDFEFDAPVSGLAASHIAVTEGSGLVMPGALTGNGASWSLAVTVVRPGGVTVAINRPGIAGVSRTVVVFVQDPLPPDPARFVRVQGGTFLMGSNPGGNETPMRNVTLSPFYMSRFQVTQGEWYDVMGTRPSFFNGNNAMNTSTWQSMPTTPELNWRNLPVEQVSWYDAIVFANRLSVARGLSPTYEMPNVWPNPTSWSSDPATWGTVPTDWDDPLGTRWDQVRIVPGSTGYRLPTEAQREFAAMGGSESRNYEFSGGNNLNEVAWHSGNSGSRTHPVGTRTANELGLYDMSGNVWEWVWDWFGTYPSVAETDPVGASSGSARVARGGGWGYSDWNLRPVFRFNGIPVFRWNNNGVRLVRPASPSLTAMDFAVKPDLKRRAPALRFVRPAEA